MEAQLQNLLLQLKWGLRIEEQQLQLLEHNQALNLDYPERVVAYDAARQ